MAALTVNADRSISGGEYDRLETEAAAAPFQGSLLSHAAADGFVKPLVAGESFAGICIQQITSANAGSADGDVRVEAIKGIFRFRASAVAGATGKGDIGTPVYASDDNTLTTTSTGNTLIGKIDEYDSELGVFIIAAKTAGYA